MSAARYICIFSALVVAAPGSFADENEPMRAPFEAAAPRSAGLAMSCPAPIPAQRDIRKLPFYSDAAQTVTDKAKWDAAWRETAALRQFAQAVSTASDEHRRGRPGAAACVAVWLDAWASDRAMLGDVNIWGRWDAVWFAQIAAGVSYLKVRDDASFPDERRARIEDWLKSVANQVLEAERSLQRYHEHPTNLHYWAGAAAAVAGIAANDRALANTGFEMARDGLRSVTPEGALPAEIKRRGKAFQYHIWALEPLSLTIALARVNGVDLLAENNGAFMRVLDFVRRGVRDPSRIVELSGATQEGLEESWPKVTADLAFAEIALGMADAPLWAPVVAARRPIYNARLGGDITSLFSRRPNELRK